MHCDSLSQAKGARTSRSNQEHDRVQTDLSYGTRSRHVGRWSSSAKNRMFGEREGGQAYLGVERGNGRQCVRFLEQGLDDAQAARQGGPARQHQFPGGLGRLGRRFSGGGAWMGVVRLLVFVVDAARATRVASRATCLCCHGGRVVVDVIVVVVVVWSVPTEETDVMGVAPMTVVVVDPHGSGRCRDQQDGGDHRAYPTRRTDARTRCASSAPGYGPRSGARSCQANMAVGVEAVAHAREGRPARGAPQGKSIRGRVWRKARGGRERGRDRFALDRPSVLYRSTSVCSPP